MSARKTGAAFISVINSIKVPKHMTEQAITVRNTYVDYFKRQPGFVSSTFYKSADDDSTFNYINVVVWENQEAVDAVVNAGFSNSDGMNRDGLKVLGKGFPAPIEVFPGRYSIVNHDD